MLVRPESQKRWFETSNGMTWPDSRTSLYATLTTRSEIKVSKLLVLDELWGLESGTHYQLATSDRDAFLAEAMAPLIEIRLAHDRRGGSKVLPGEAHDLGRRGGVLRGRDSNSQPSG